MPGLRLRLREADDFRAVGIECAIIGIAYRFNHIFLVAEVTPNNPFPASLALAISEMQAFI